MINFYYDVKDGEVPTNLPHATLDLCLKQTCGLTCWQILITVMEKMCSFKTSENSEAQAINGKHH